MRLNLKQNLRNAFRALLANKLRSGLTMLGIIIGVASVVALLAVGTGAQSAVNDQIQGLGANLITVMAGKQQSVGPNAGNTATTAILTLKDAEKLQGLKGVGLVAPQYRTTKDLTYQAEKTSVSVTGAVPEYAQAHPDEVAKGRFISESDQKTRARVVVLGLQTATDLFGGVNPLGKSIKINGMPFQVIGVMKEQGSGGFGNRDEAAYVPLETAYARLAGTQALVGSDRIVSTIEVSAADEDSIDTAVSQIEKTLRRSHRLKAGEDNDFSVTSQTDILSVTSSVTTILTVLLGSVAAISLLVGGIGVMNIMLVSVTERTKEIGLRKAVGARRRDILYQFLTETITLSVSGGIIGILIGWAIAALVNLTGVLTPRVSIESVVLAFGFSAAVGIFFGIYPANRAAGLRPIEALRYE